jgi:hypothetical protein
MTADGMATVTIETTIASDAHHRASLHPAIGLIATLITGDSVTVGGQTRIRDRTTTTAVEGAATRTGRMSLRATSLSAWTSQLASPTTCPTASRRTGARREEMVVEVDVEVALAGAAGLAGSHHPTPLNEP